MRIAINGFGRIGKNITRHLIDAGFLAGQEGDLELVAINDLGDIKSNSHLLKIRFNSWAQFLMMLVIVTMR